MKNTNSLPLLALPCALKSIAPAAAMDLGTSNTCVTLFNDKGLAVQQPEGWHSTALGGAIPSLVLYKDDAPFLIGAAAELEFGEAGKEERKRYKLCALFKPDITAREDARAQMYDFLSLLRPRILVGEHFLVGVPCEAGNLYQQVLRQCLKEAGFEKSAFLQEPLGAIIHAITSGALPPSKAAEGVLTVDFGGGTCDMAFLRRAEVLARYGDMLYGGRLFDDLFWQILLQENPALEARLEEEGNRYYVHWIACRQAKELFSNAMHRDRTQPVTVRVRWSHWDGEGVRESSAYIENVTWERFLLWAGDYTPSPELLAQMKEHATRAGLSEEGRALLEGKRVDLIQWFERLFRQSLAQRENGSTPQILLTGGSSAWPFVTDIVHQTLGDSVRILLGDEPYADIARGLAQYYSFSQALQRGRKSLKKELPSFMESRIRQKAVERTVADTLDKALNASSDFLRTVVLLPCFEKYRQEGGTLRHLILSMNTALEERESMLRGVFAEHLDQLAGRVAKACRDELQGWFASKGIPILPEKLKQGWFSLSADMLAERMRETLASAALKPLREQAGWATALTLGGAAGTVGSLALGGFFPLALLAGLVGGIAIKLLRMDARVVETFLDIPLPALVRKPLLSEKRVQGLCTEQLAIFRKELKEIMLMAWKEGEGALLEDAARIVREEIDALDILYVTPT